jgi:hypothetical protein
MPFNGLVPTLKNIYERGPAALIELLQNNQIVEESMAPPKYIHAYIHC